MLSNNTNKRQFRVKDPQILDRLDQESNQSKIINRALNEYYFKPAPSDTDLVYLKDITKQISGIAKNLNQQTKAFNMNKHMPDLSLELSDVKSIANELHPLIKKLKTIIVKWVF